ncbi:MAG: hypothetical protein Q9224_002684, partial [Gallowayella concinna]
ENHPLGYPRFSALIGAHPAFNLSRRFTVARARLLLQKQDRVSVLEEKLQVVDREEQRLLFLGSLRRDTNTEREDLLSELDHALVERNARMLQLPAASTRNRLSLINWVEGTGSICRQEANFLFEEDLCGPQGSVGSELRVVESLVERACVRIYQYLQKPASATASRDDRVFIFAGTTITTVARLLITWLLIILLLVPVIVVHAVDGIVPKVVCIMMASGIFVSILADVLHARMAEIFVAGATKGMPPY